MEAWRRSEAAKRLNVRASDIGSKPSRRYGELAVSHRKAVSGATGRRQAGLFYA